MLLADVTLLELLGALDRIGMAGLAVAALYFLWNRMTKQIDALQKIIESKDTQIADLEEKRNAALVDHSEKIEALQDKTIEKVEAWGDKTGGLVERVIELQTKISTSLDRLEPPSGD